MTLTRRLLPWLLCAPLALAPALVANALDMSNSVWSETDASNNSTPPDGWPAGMNPSQVEPAARAMMGAMKRFWDRTNATITTTGSAGAYVYTPTNASYPTAYVNGEVYVFKANFTSVGNDTLNVNALGAKNLYKSTSASGITQLVAGDIQTGAMVQVVYNSALNSSAGGFQVLSRSQTMTFAHQVFYTSGTYTPTTGMVSIIVTCKSGGGGGGGINGSGTAFASGAGGGGEGGAAVIKFTAAQIGASQAVTVGAGGAGGAGISGANGANGGVSSLGSGCTSGAGGGGAGTVGATGGIPGAGGTGGSDLTVYGMAGFFGNLGPNTVAAIGGSGGHGGIGGYAVGGCQAGAAAAVNGGGGGGGAACQNTINSANGGAGAAGFVEILELVVQ